MSTLLLRDVPDLVGNKGDLFAKHFSAFIGKLATTEDNSSSLHALACLLIHAQSQGHVCLDLTKPPAVQQEDSYHTVIMPDLDDLVADLEPFRDTLIAFDSEPGKMPFILKNGRYLYLSRYGNYEDNVRKRIIDWSRQAVEPCVMPPDGLFGKEDEATPQYEAVRKALDSRFSIIAGGPGTGKTTITVKILAASLARNPDLNIALAAPTGKAAARMKESITKNILQLETGAAIKLKVLSLDAYTLHRLLEPRYNSPYFKRNRDNTLPHDMVIVDEASMIDLPMMAKLFNAIASGTTLVLIGDPDQLPPVEVGSVFGQIVRGGLSSRFLTTLRENYRAKDSREIIELCTSINNGDLESALGRLGTSGSDSVSWIRLSGEDTVQQLIRQATLHFRDLFRQSDSEHSGEVILEGINRFRILTALRAGPYGAETINEHIRKRLGPGQELIMVTRNDAENRIFNGDIGVKVTGEANSMVWIDGKNSPISSLRIPGHQLAYAMTGHKAQGSEFEEVHIVLPLDEGCPLLTREWLYTAVSRARSKVTIWATEAALRQCVCTRIVRASGMELD